MDAMLRRLVSLLLFSSALPAAGEYFVIKVIDAKTGRGVPLVRLATNNHITCYTDSNGVVAWNEPGLMDRDVFFQIDSPGYEFSGGGKTLHTTRGSAVELKIRRLNIAERIYRVTGQGIYRDSILAGYPVPIREPVLNAEVLGQDTVRVVPYRGKLFWLWGDTDRAGGRLGNFATTSATSELPGHGGLDPSVGVDLNYFRGADGFVKPMCPWPVPGLKWLHALLTVNDPSGVERLIARYDSLASLTKTNESGLAVFNDETQQFDRLVVFPSPDPRVGPGGVPPLRVRSGGLEYFYFCDLSPLPGVRVRADWKSIQDLSNYEVFDTSWVRRSTLPKARNPWLDFETGLPVDASVKVQWNAFRKRWIGILQKNVGEVWYAEADTPVGPWVYTTRIATHGQYTFYWPAQHSFFDQDGGRTIYFEGTYTESFSGNAVITPRYNYNQLMYKLSLDDERLSLPAPVYRLKDGRLLTKEGLDTARAWTQIAEIPFFAIPPDRKRAGIIEIGSLFGALPAEAQVPAPGVTGSWQCRDAGFALTITADGDRLKVQADELPPVSGVIRNGIATFRIEDDDDFYDATAFPRSGKLALQWKEKAGAGQAVCDPLPSDPWINSRAIVPLYFYNGVYTTKARPGAKPVARVWRNPSAVLALDPDAAPVQRPPQL
jgi:hypothetical protein